MLIANNYGYFRDELYYIVAGERLSFGYVDFPPVIALLAAFARYVAGDSLVSIHVFPAVAGAATVYVSGAIARELGGGRRAQVLAAIATMFSASLAVSSLFTVDVLDMMWWAIISLLVVKIIKNGDAPSPRLWIELGIVAGIALMTKLTVAFFLLSLIVAFALTTRRAYLRSPWVWLASVIAFLILLPYVVWNALNGWPTVDFFIHHGGLNGDGPASFLANQLLIAGVLGLPLAIAGLVFYFRSKEGRAFAVLGIAFVILLIVYTLTNAKPYFMMGAYPLAFAGGAVLFERIFRRRFILPSYLAGILIVGIAIAPLYTPLLPPQTFIQYYGALTGAANSAGGQQTAGSFPQYLGDRFGWDTMTATVASVYYGLPSQERSQACILTLNYGEASALTFLGTSHGLPPVISGHNNYFLWGTRGCSGAVLIIVGYSPSDFQGDFQSITVAANITCSYCVPDENNLPVIVATGPNFPSAQSAWGTLKHYN